MAAAALAIGDDLGFQEHEGRWQDVLHRHGLAWLAAVHSLGIAYVEISVGKAEVAERRLRVAREFLGSLGNVWWIDLVDGCLCDAVGAQDRPREFLRLADAFSASVQMTDRETLVRTPTVARQSPPASRVSTGGGSRREARARARGAKRCCAQTRERAAHARRGPRRARSTRRRRCGAKPSHREASSQGEPGSRCAPQFLTAYSRTAKTKSYSATPLAVTHALRTRLRELSGFEPLTSFWRRALAAIDNRVCISDAVGNMHSGGPEPLRAASAPDQALAGVSA